MNDRTRDDGRWHVADAVLAIYARGEVTGADALSADAHLATCDRCRDVVAAHADAARLDAIWDATHARLATPTVASAATAPRPSGARPGRDASPLDRLAHRVALPVAVLMLIAGLGRVVSSGADGAAPVAVEDPRPAPTVTVEPPPVATEDPDVRWPDPAVATPTGPPPAADAPVLAAPFALETFDACEDLRSRLAADATERVTPYGLEGASRDGIPQPLPATDDGVAAADSEGPGPAFSGTNVQEVGVDEPDQVKTDGRFAYVVVDGAVTVVDLTGDAPREVSRWSSSGAPAEQLLLAGDRLLVVGHDRIGFERRDGSVGYHPVTLLTLLDITDRGAPRVIGEAELDGVYVNARQVDQFARLVVQTPPWQLDFVQPGSDRNEEEAVAENRAVIAAASAQQFLPLVRFGPPPSRSAARPLAPCDDAHVPVEFAGFGAVSVVSVDLGGRLEDLQATSVQAGAETVYADADTLYIATTRWTDPVAPAGGEDFTTEIHAFDIGDPYASRYVASGRVGGHLINQFALSEHGGHLRVATTEGAPWSDGTESVVRVLAQREGRLEVVGEVGGLGRGERIFAVRYVGDTGYVVTFRKIDPLYTLDLSDPTAPHVLGELKIPGFSAYLHPTGPGRLLGVGQDADDEGRVQGGQVSLFDVSDPAQPRRIDSEPLGDGGSSVEHDHRAFLYWPGTGLVVVPAWRWPTEDGGGEAWAGALAFTLSGDDLVPTAEFSHPATGGYPSPIERSFVAGDALYTVSSAGLLANDLRTLDERAWLAW